MKLISLVFNNEFRKKWVLFSVEHKKKLAKTGLEKKVGTVYLVLSLWNNFKDLIKLVVFHKKAGAFIYLAGSNCKVDCQYSGAFPGS